MNVARTPKSARTLLTAVGVLMILIGAGTIAYSFFALKPKVAALPREINRSLEVIDKSAAALGANDELLASSVAAAQSGARALSSLPQVLKNLRSTLESSSRLLYSASDAAAETTEGVTGLVAPEEELKRSADRSEQTARNLRQLSRSLKDLQSASADVAASGRAISKQLEQIEGGRAPAAEVVETARSRLQATQSAIDEASLPSHIAIAASGVGGLYIFIGVIALILARALKLDSAIPS